MLRVTTHDSVGDVSCTKYIFVVARIEINLAAAVGEILGEVLEANFKARKKALATVGRLIFFVASFDTRSHYTGVPMRLTEIFFSTPKSNRLDMDE